MVDEYMLGLMAGRCGYKYGEGYREVPPAYRRGYVEGFRNPERPLPRTLSQVAADKEWSW